jgi:hypothetical protein
LGYPEFVINLINKIRINPKDYANIIEESMKNIVEEESETDSSERTIIYKSEIKVALFKGREAFEEAANELIFKFYLNNLIKNLRNKKIKKYGTYGAFRIQRRELLRFTR